MQINKFRQVKVDEPVQSEKAIPKDQQIRHKYYKVMEKYVKPEVCVNDKEIAKFVQYLGTAVDLKSQSNFGSD